MIDRIADLKDQDLVHGEPLECPECGCYMILSKKLNNGVGRRGEYRRRKFECSYEGCHHTDIIYADGGRDVEPFRKEEIETKKIEKLNRKL